MPCLRAGRDFAEDWWDIFHMRQPSILKRHLWDILIGNFLIFALGFMLMGSNLIKKPENAVIFIMGNQDLRKYIAFYTVWGHSRIFHIRGLRREKARKSMKKWFWRLRNI